MEYKVNKSVCERYDFRFDQWGWAKITIDERDGMFSAQSDYGTYAYSWPHHGRKSFKHFLIEIARDSHYFLKKVSSRTHSKAFWQAVQREQERVNRIVRCGVESYYERENLLEVGI